MAEKKAQRIAIIGAGPSGTAALRAFQSAISENCEEEIPEIVCFEKQDDWGGLWNYTNQTGVDEYGEPVHSSMYRFLWSNGPKECLEFADYSFKEHFGKPIASYPPRPVLADYIKGRMEKAAVVRDWCRFRAVVRMVSFSDETQKFTVMVHDLVQDHVYTEDFDYVVVATGHFSTPNLPHFDGIESFPGRVLHAHDFRNALEFQNQNVMVVGSSYSAEDIGSQCWKYGAKSITVSYRSNPIGFKWPDNWEERPMVVRVEGKNVHFVDGTCKEVDSIILCTGYKHHFPFLQDELRLKTENRLWPLGLYKGVVWEKNPKLFYLGMQDQFYTFNMFDAQAWFARDVILGRIELPNQDEMHADSLAWREREETLQTDHDQIWFQGDYVKELLRWTEYPDFDVDGVNRTFEEWEHHKSEDIMGYRDRPYRSLMTGDMAPVHHTPWVEAMDDSMESYLRE